VGECRKGVGRCIYYVTAISTSNFHYLITKVPTCPSFPASSIPCTTSLCIRGFLTRDLKFPCAIGK